MTAQETSAACVRDSEGVYRLPVAQTILRDQWGLRIVHCHDERPHRWHGWVSANEDLRCPGVAHYEGGRRVDSR